ncbi:MAG: hypothetical protein IJ428_00725 [Clostridia bacterium]|nr:hypothetical protein [Clostridia bacterium]
MQKLKTAACCIGVFCVTLAALLFMLILSAMIPNSAIQDNMLKSAFSYKDKDAFTFENGAALNAISDNYADTILLQLSMNMGRGAPLVSALDTKYYDGESLGESIGFYLSLIDSDTEYNVDYTRYWHGSAMFIRLFHLFTDVDGIKLIGFAAVVLLALLAAAMLIKARHCDIAAVLILSSAAVSVWNVRLSLEYIPAFVIGYLMCVLYLFFERKRDSFLIYLSVLGGVLIAFFDFLTCETVSILLPLVLVTAVRAKEKRLGELKPNLILYFSCGAAWLLSYAATFVSKWTLASLVTGENKLVTALSSAGERIAGDTSYLGFESGIARIPLALIANLSTIFGGEERIDVPHMLVGLALTAAVIFSVLYLFRSKQADQKCATVLLIILGSVIFGRYMMLNNHSLIHEFFTYRALISSIAALLSAVLLNISLPVKKGGRGKLK